MQGNEINLEGSKLIVVGLGHTELRDFIRLNDATKTALELYDKMLELYPDRANSGSLWSLAAVAKTQS